MGDGRSAGTCRASPATGRESARCGKPWKPRARLGVPYLTLYAFSVENWKRPHTEIKLLMGLLRAVFEEGNRRTQPAEYPPGGHREDSGTAQAGGRGLAQSLWTETRQNTGMRLVLALNYGARAELVDAVQELLDQAKRNGSMTVDEALLSEHLYTRGLPDPDLLIRTSGELRLSNFLLWQVAYAELWVTETLWPDFTQEDLFQAIIDFQKRERRYGGLGMS